MEVGCYLSLLLDAMCGKYAGGNKVLLGDHGDVFSIQGPPLGQLCKEGRCWASVLDGEERGERGAVTPWVCLILLLVRAYGLVSKCYHRSVSCLVKISNF